MARKPPTSKLSAGAALVASIRAEMDAENVDPTSPEVALLRLASVLADRIEALEEIIATDGEILTSSRGVVRVHPAAIEHRQLALALARVLGGVVIGDSAGGGKNPIKQRAAAVRWANHNQRKEARGY